MALDEVRQARQQNLTQPAQKLGLRTALELSEVAMRLEHRLLDDVRRADARSQAALQLRSREQRQVVAIYREQFADRLLIALAGTREQPASAGAVSAARLTVAQFTVAQFTVAHGGRVAGSWERKFPRSTVGALRRRHGTDMNNEEMPQRNRAGTIIPDRKGANLSRKFLGANCPHLQGRHDP